MRKFRYIEPGHGDDSLSNHEINELDMDFDIKVNGFYALMPVTKYEFGLLVSSSNRDWTREDERLPVDEPGAEKQWKLADDPIMLSDEVIKFIKAEIKDELDRRGFENGEY